MMLPTVNCAAACRWCSRWTICSVVCPRFCSRPSSQSKTGATAGVLVAQPLRQLRDEGAVEFLAAAEPLGQRRGHPVRLAAREFEYLVGERVRLFARRARRHDARREAAQILHQRQPQADGDRPQFADGERPVLLVGAYEAPQRLGVEAAVGMRDEGQRQRIDARVARQLAALKLRQLAVVADRQVFAYLAQLVFDDVEVIDEPLGCGRDGALPANRLGERTVGREKLARVIFEARQERAAAPRPFRHLVLGGERRGVLLKALAAEQLFADGGLVRGSGGAAK